MTEIKHKDEGSYGSFQIFLDGRPAGKMTYIWAAKEVFAIYRTEVDEAFNGNGLGKEMLGAAANYARMHNKKIIPICDFAKAGFQLDKSLLDVLVD